MPITKPPTGAGNSPEVPVAEIYEALGVPLALCTQKYEELIVDATIAEFADGEIEVTHEPLEDAVARRYYGEASYNQGELGPLLRGALEGTDQILSGKVDGLVRHAARALAREAILDKSKLPAYNNVRILPAELPLSWPAEAQKSSQIVATAEGLHKAGYALLEFDKKIAQLAHRPQHVVDYGPGLQGRHKVDIQYQMLVQGQRPFAYAAIGKGPFINEFLQTWWRERLGPENQSLWPDIVHGGTYVGREDGIAEASHNIVYGHPDYPDGVPPMVDVVLASGIHTAGHEAAQKGIQNAYHMLKPLGVLLLRAPQKQHVKDTEVHIEEMQEMAADAGFKISQAIVRNTVTRSRMGAADIASRAVLIYK